MRTIPYDTSRDALYRPYLAPSVFPIQRLSDDLLCAESSRLAYKHFERTSEAKSEVDEALRSVGFEEVAYFAREDSQAFAAWSSGSRTAVVAFRGTEQDDPTDLANDLDTLPASWDTGGRVHRGFKRAFHKIWQDDIKAWIDRHPGRLLFTGHSLGAALSTLAASLRKPEKLITFGSPRVGDSGFVQTLSGVPTFRYVDCCDLVTHLPPSGFGFEHLETRIYIDRLGQIVPDVSEEIRQDCWTAREEYLLSHAWKKGSVAVRDLADHAPINYIHALMARA